MTQERRDWKFLRETHSAGEQTKAQQGTFRIAAVRRPQHMFIWFQLTDVENDQNNNPLVFNTFNIGADRTTIKAAQPTSI